MNEYALVLSPEQLITFTGVEIGTASSKYDTHNHDADRPVNGQRCSACRWQEVRLFKRATGDYAVYTVGRSVVPGEKDFIKYRTTTSAFEVIELLTVRNGSNTFLPVPAARALAQAAQHDDDIRDAYVNRAVA